MRSYTARFFKRKQPKKSIIIPRKCFSKTSLPFFKLFSLNVELNKGSKLKIIFMVGNGNGNGLLLVINEK